MRLLFLLAMFVAASLPTDVLAETILFESGTLGQTGVPISEVINQNVPGTNISTAAYAGVRFQLDQPAITSKVGGHFVSGSNGTFFGAIVALDSENDFPDSGDFSTSDFLGSTLLEFPIDSDEVFGDLSLSLDPGWYALVFGSGLFGTNGVGATPRNNADIGSPTYIGFGSGWSDITPIARNYRFVVKGVIVPEPASIVVAFSALILLIAQKRPR